MQQFSDKVVLITGGGADIGRAAALQFAAQGAKAAIEQLTRCWALERAPDGIRVNAVAAGPTETDFLVERMQLTAAQAEAVKTQERRSIPLGRRGSPEEVAHWILALAAPAAAWVTGQVVTVDGGLDAT